MHKLIYHDSHRFWGLSQTIKLPCEIKRNHIYDVLKAIPKYFKIYGSLVSISAINMQA